MELGITLLVLCVVVWLGLTFIKNKAGLASLSSGKASPVNEKILKEELERRKKILVEVESFLKGSEYFEPIARWRDGSIYRYILNDGKLYEFSDIMVEENQRVGRDDDFLCFKQLSYKRVTDPTDFISKHKAVQFIQNHNEA